MCSIYQFPTLQCLLSSQEFLPYKSNTPITRLSAMSMIGAAYSWTGVHQMHAELHKGSKQSDESGTIWCTGWVPVLSRCSANQELNWKTAWEQKFGVGPIRINKYYLVIKNEASPCTKCTSETKFIFLPQNREYNAEWAAADFPNSTGQTCHCQEAARQVHNCRVSPMVQDDTELIFSNTINEHWK